MVKLPRKAVIQQACYNPDCDLTRCERDVVMALCYFDYGGSVFPSNKKLMQSSKIKSRTTIKKTIDDLVKKKLLEIAYLDGKRHFNMSKLEKWALLITCGKPVENL